jgi:succinoglycan biosynthesis protein ExoV
MAGFEFLDPCADSEETVQRIRKAGLVVAAAMHAAIVADALRVPWIPVAISPGNSTFKWLDWTLSLNLPYYPTKLPASTMLESVGNHSIRCCGPSYFLEDRTASNAIEHYKRIMKLKSRTYWPLWRKHAMQITDGIPKRILASPPFRGFVKQQDKDRAHRAADELRRVGEMPSYLSDENVLLTKLERIADLLYKVRL